MRTLRLVALSDDGTSLILAAEGPDSADSGERFELPIDDRLRAAARGDARRLTQIDVDLGTELPPRIIQARIRAGETPEQVAAASGTRVERIMRFAHPVIQEREQWASGCNFVAVRPGVVLGYARNEETMRELERAAGYRVITAIDFLTGEDQLEDEDRAVIAFEGAELVRGGGGGRCMTLPVARDDIW